MGPEQAVDDAMQRICAGSVSTHALREESDKFEGDDHGIDAKISIHALREESDILLGILLRVPLNFNPRPPWGKRPDKPKTPAPAKQFQSAISTWKATTDKLIVYDEAYMISIHALREESDAPVSVR